MFWAAVIFCNVGREVSVANIQYHYRLCHVCRMFTKKQQPKPKLSLRKVVDDARKQAVREKLTSNSSDASLPPAVPDADGKPKAMDNGEEPADVSELATHAQWHSLTRTAAYMLNAVSCQRTHLSVLFHCSSTCTITWIVPILAKRNSMAQTNAYSTCT